MILFLLCQFSVYIKEKNQFFYPHTVNNTKHEFILYQTFHHIILLCFNNIVWKCIEILIFKNKYIFTYDILWLNASRSELFERKLNFENTYVCMCKI